MSALRLLLAFCLALLAPWGQAAAAARPDVQATSAPVWRPLLWKAEHGGNVVYLLGSFHLLAPSDAPLPAEIERAFQDSDALLFELDPAALTAPETIAAMQTAMGYGDGKTLSEVLPAPVRQRLGVLVGASGGSLDALEHSEPWAVNLGMTLAVANALGLRAELGLDRQLMARAAQAGKPVAGLETVQAQVQAMDRVPYQEQVQSLDEFLADPKKAAQQLQQLHDWWRAGDVEVLDRRMRMEMAQKTPESYRLLNVERNQAWLPQVDARLTAATPGRTLVVVGALHLLGPEGLVEQLRARGYRVERICDSCSVATSGQ
ncbi:TraB/GumN family protein [Thermomonas hydrothermalis]|uniref:TraB family protein n=1 Tax=Thermomonas hydrothermalis TaxID=213588 RepID=A0A1M4XGR6_9GAMM|nr:TraB/GumN family protein [Thermomonas hydrothermalis]SHE92699.1 hypothetical protein SAMN02745204_01424 [Thermomonas hydrothermalis]